MSLPLNVGWEQYYSSSIVIAVSPTSRNDV
jgi:hypothetical protein